MSSIRNIAKKIIPRKEIWRFRLMRKGLHYRSLLKKLRSGEIKNADYLIGTPLHDNLGDHLITLSEIKIFDELQLDKSLIEIPLEFFRLYSNELVAGVSTDARIFINGGGWMGDVWPDDEYAIQQAVELFKNNQVVVFPQTIYYSSNEEASQNIKDSGALVYNSHPALTMFFRERNSYEVAKGIYENLDVRLAPDMALAYFDYAPKRQTANKVVGFCLRDDREKAPDKLLDGLIDHIDKKRYETKKVTTIHGSLVPAINRETTVEDALREFASCGVVVTDRLHAMLFCYLTNTPCIVFDNATKKISGVYQEWLKDAPSILPLFIEENRDLATIDGFLSSAIELVYQNRSLDNEFNALRSLISNG